MKWRTMDRKQKEDLVTALLEKGETYREITKQAGVSPNTVKAVANKMGLDQNTSVSSRALELYVKQKTPLQVAIELDIKAEDAMHLYHQYFMLLGITEFTKAYLQVKDNPWPFVDLVKLTQNSRMKDGEVVELLKIANGYLPRVRLEYDRINEEINSVKAELNSSKVELSNAVRIYQQFCDRNLELKKREDELRLSINELEAKEAELNESLSQTLHVPHIEDGISSVEGGNKKIFDTGELSHDTLALDNIEFQGFFEPQEKSNGSAIWPRKDEFEGYDFER